MKRTCLKAQIEANLNASSLESTAWAAPSIKTTRRFSTGCPIKAPLYGREKLSLPYQKFNHTSKTKLYKLKKIKNLDHYIDRGQKLEVKY